jgi:cell division protein FtsA
MNPVNELIIGIDLGSNGLKGVLGKRSPKGVEVIALQQIPVFSGVRKGVIHNIEVVSNGINELINTLKRSVPQRCIVKKVYIGLNGYSIRTIDVHSVTSLSGEEILNDMHLDNLADQIPEKVPDMLEIVDVFPQEFIVDGKIDINPVGSMPTKVEAHYKVVVCKPLIFKNLKTCFERLDIQFDQLLGPIASAEAVLKSEEKSRGVVVVDFGAETTSVCIYKSNVLLSVSVLPFGGFNITKDLTYLNIDNDEAESIKIEKGSAIHYSENIVEDPEDETRHPGEEEKEINEVIVARAEEIIENIYAQIRYSGAELQKLKSGIVITGGASQLNGIDTVLSRKTGLSVRYGDPCQNIIYLREGLVVEPGDAQTLGLLLLGKPDCCIEEPVVEKVVEPVAPKPAPGELFGDDEIEVMPRRSFFGIKRSNHKPAKTKVEDTSKNTNNVEKNTTEDIEKPEKPDKSDKSDKSGGIFGGFIDSIFKDDI